MGYQDVYYVDDIRGASPVVVDHRTGSRVPVSLPARTTVVTAPAATGPFGSPYQYGPGQMAPNWGGGWNTGWHGGWNGGAGYPTYPQYAMPPVPPTSNLASILGGFGDIGTLANIIAQAFAAFLPLPTPPTPQDGSDTDQATNAALNSSNLIRYQSALAGFARRDQQILTLGSVLRELFKRPGMVMG
jgi:hypothetical protein